MSAVRCGGRGGVEYGGMGWDAVGWDWWVEWESGEVGGKVCRMVRMVSVMDGCSHEESELARV